MGFFPVTALSLFFCAVFATLTAIPQLDGAVRGRSWAALCNIFLAAGWILFMPQSRITWGIATVATGMGVWISIRNI